MIEIVQYQAKARRTRHPTPASVPVWQRLSIPLQLSLSFSPHRADGHAKEAEIRAQLDRLLGLGWQHELEAHGDKGRDSRAAVDGPRDGAYSHAANLRGDKDERQLRDQREHIHPVVVGEGPGEPGVVRQFLPQHIVAVRWWTGCREWEKSEAVPVAVQDAGASGHESRDGAIGERLFGEERFVVADEMGGGACR